MTTECTTERLEFERFRRQRVVGRFDGGELGSDDGGLLLRELAQRTGLFRQLSACFRDHRDPQRTQHPVEVLVAARVLGLALGYEDLIDHDTLRQSKLWSLLCGAARRGRRRASWEALPPGKSTLNRMELMGLALDAGERYKKIVADTARLDALLVDLFLDWHGEQPERIVLDVDAMDDPLHGRQEGRFFHGYYRSYCYLPLYEEVYCARGDMENRIKEQQLALFADRTSAQTMRANQLRLYFASFAYALLELLRRWGLSGTRLARAQCGTIRLKLLKIGVRIRVSVRAVRLSFDEGFPEAGLFGQVLARLQSLPLCC